MPFVILPGTNKIVAAAFAGLRKDERAAKKKAAVEEEPPPVPAKKQPTQKGKRR